MVRASAKRQQTCRFLPAIEAGICIGITTYSHSVGPNSFLESRRDI